MGKSDFHHRSGLLGAAFSRCSHFPELRGVGRRISSKNHAMNPSLHACFCNRYDVLSSRPIFVQDFHFHSSASTIKLSCQLGNTVTQDWQCRPLQPIWLFRSTFPCSPLTLFRCQPAKGFLFSCHIRSL